MNDSRPLRNFPPLPANVTSLPARSLIKQALSSTVEDTVGINIQLDRDVHETLRRLYTEHGWTNRQSVELAVRVLGAELQGVQDVTPDMPPTHRENGPDSRDAS